MFGMGEGVYSHDQFIQNNLPLCLTMNRRKNSKDSKTSSAVGGNDVKFDDSSNAHASTSIPTLLPMTRKKVASPKSGLYTQECLDNHCVNPDISDTLQAATINAAYAMNSLEMMSPAWNKHTFQQKKLPNHTNMVDRCQTSTIHNHEMAIPAHHTEHVSSKRPKNISKSNLLVHNNVLRTDIEANQYQPFQEMNRALTVLRENQRILLQQLEMMGQRHNEPIRSNDFTERMIGNESHDIPAGIYSRNDSICEPTETVSTEVTMDTMYVPLQKKVGSKKYETIQGKEKDDKKVGQICGREFHLVFESDDDFTSI